MMRRMQHPSLTAGFAPATRDILDEDGYLFIRGRTKEIINRGGEKVSPREVEEVLLDHPAVAEVLVFAMHDQWLGEEVAAASVLRTSQSIDERGLRRFAAERLTDFKLPRRIVFLDEIPKGATGSCSGIGLADRLGLPDQATSPATGTESPRLDSGPSRRGSLAHIGKNQRQTLQVVCTHICCFKCVCLPFGHEPSRNATPR